MKTKLLILLGTFFLTPLLSQVNLMEDWDGNGDTNVSTSYPDQYGWDVTVGEFNYANSGSGVRWSDVTSGHYLDGSNYTGRLLMVRWDGAGATSLSSVYSYELTLESNKRYRLSFIYEWWNNASAPVMTFGIGKNKTGTDPVISEDFACSSTRQELQEGSYEFYIAEGGTYYLGISANNLAALCAVGEMEIQEVPNALQANVSEVILDYYQTEKDLTIYPNGSSDIIELSGPAGIAFDPVSLPASGGSVRVYSLDSTSLNGSIQLSQGSDQVTLPLTANFPEGFIQEVNFETLTTDGAWCWFNDPRAIYYEGSKKQTYFSWVNSRGDMMIASYNHESGKYLEHLLYPELEVDDHDNPAIFIRDDGHLVVYFSKHTSAPAHRFISTNPEDITSWGNDYRFGENVTYPYPFKVGDDIYVFYRGINWHPTLIISNDGGESMGEPMQFITGGGARPYARYCQDNTGAIHCAFTTAHPRDEANNEIYYAKFQDGKFYKADGTFIKEFTDGSTALNIDAGEAETVYDASEGKGWIWDIAVDENNNPVIAFAAFPTDLDHRYNYARWTGSEWFSTEITNAGKWFPQTPDGAGEPEPNYSGGIILDYDDPSTVYLSKEVKESFEIFRFRTEDGGLSWDSTALTWNTDPELVNVRPIVPRHHQEGLFDLVWMRGKYTFYTNYHTELVFWSDSIVNELQEINFAGVSDTLDIGENKTLQVEYIPFTTSLRDLTWSSSNPGIVSVEKGVLEGLAEGSAVITVSGAGGVGSSITIVVKEAERLAEGSFDFGTTTSPVASGFSQVTGSNLYEGLFGWESTVTSRDRETNSNNELRDFNYASSDASFLVNLEGGKYYVKAVQGDQIYSHDQMNIYVNDELKSASKSAGTGSFVSSEFNIEVEPGVADFRFNDGGGSDANWVVNSLQIKKAGLNTSASSIPPFTNFVNRDSSWSFLLSGLGLSEDLSLDILGANASSFSVSPGAISLNGKNIISNIPVFLEFLPIDTGSHTAVLSINSGDYSLEFDLAGRAVPLPLLSTDPGTLPHFSTTLSEKDSRSLFLNASHLQGAVELYISGNDSSMFYLNKELLPFPLNGEIIQEEIVITYNPTRDSSHIALLNIISPHASPLALDLTGSASPVSVNTTDIPGFQVYSNNNSLFISGSTSFQVYSINGSLIHQVSSSKNQHELSLPRGIYLIKSNQQVRKAIVF